MVKNEVVLYIRLTNSVKPDEPTVGDPTGNELAAWTGPSHLPIFLTSICLP